MNAVPSDVQEQWKTPLQSRRFVGAACDVVLDFEWQSLMPHNQPRFSGLQDLSQAVEKHAAQLTRTPLLLLTSRGSTVFDEILTPSHYVAVVNLAEFLKCTSGLDKSATFFLSTVSRHGPLSALAQVARFSEPERLQAVQFLGECLKDGGSMLSSAIGSAGLELAGTILNATVRALGESTSAENIQTLASSFSSGAATFLADVANTAKRRIGIELFEELLVRDATEHEFQRWFQDNSWVLGTHCVRVLDDRRIDVENVADYLVKSLDGRADIVEIKRPRLSFWRAEKDHGNYVPHADLVAAFIQAQNYQFALEKAIDSIATRERLQGIPIAKPASLLIHGRSVNWIDAQFEAQRLLNAGFCSLCVITYDQVLLRARALCGLREELVTRKTGVAESCPAS